MTRTPLLFSLLALLIAAPAFAQGGPPPAKVVLDEARVETLTEVRGVTGEIRSPMRSQLAVQVEGIVTEMLVDDGDDVEAGQLIARIDDTRAKLDFERNKADLDHAEALVAQRQAEHDEAERDLERFLELERRGSVGESEIDEARTLLASRAALLAQANAELLSAKSDLALAERELADTSIRAPFSGRVVETSTEVGQWIARGGPVATIVSLDLLEARINVPQQYYRSLRDAKGEIEIVVPAIEGTVSGTLIAIIPQADSLSRLFPARIRIKDSDAILRPGMSITAMVPTGTQSEQLTVSKDAIVRTTTGEHLYYSDNGVAAMMPVQRLFAAGSRVAIRRGALQPGMEIVVDGNERMFPGQPLIPLPEPEPVVNETSPITETE